MGKGIHYFHANISAYNTSQHLAHCGHPYILAFALVALEVISALDLLLPLLLALPQPSLLRLTQNPGATGFTKTDKTTMYHVNKIFSSQLATMASCYENIVTIQKCCLRPEESH